MIDGTSIEIGDIAEVFYQEPKEGADIAEPAIVIRRYENDEAFWAILQGDNEILIGGVETMKRLSKALAAWAKKEADRA